MLVYLLTASRFANVAQSASANQNYVAWADIDLDEKAWLIPTEKMKVPANGRHEVPLSEQAVSILQRLKRFGLAFRRCGVSQFSRARDFGECR